MRQIRRRSADDRDLPSYELSEAAWILRVPQPTISRWLMRPGSLKGKRGDPTGVLKPALATPPTLSFWNLVEAYTIRLFRNKGVKLPAIREALEYLEETLGCERPLIREKLYTDGKTIFIDTAKKMLLNANDAGQLTIRPFLIAHLSRVQFDAEGLAQTFSPWVEAPDEDRKLLVDPRYGFGRLLLSDSKLPAEPLHGRFIAGDSVTEIAADYRIPVAEVETAIRWYARPKAA